MTSSSRPPGIPVRESRNPKFPTGIPGNFWNSGGNYGEFIGVLSFFSIFIVDYDNLLFNLTHCIMCPTHDGFTAFWTKPWMTSLTQRFVFIEFRYTFKYWYYWTASEFRKLNLYTNEDAEINNYNRSLAKVLHFAWDGRCSKGRQCPGDVCPNGGRVCWYNGDRLLPVSLDMWDGWKAVGAGVDFKLKTSRSMYTDHIIVTDSNKCR